MINPGLTANKEIGIRRDNDMHIRVANIKDIEQLRRLYLELETDGVKYQPEQKEEGQILLELRFFHKISMV